jgi:hypothetical protein
MDIAPQAVHALLGFQDDGQLELIVAEFDAQLLVLRPQRRGRVGV